MSQCCYLPEEIVNRIFMFMSSPTCDIFRQSKYYRVCYPFRKLYEVSKRPLKCRRLIRHEYYEIYFNVFLETLGENAKFIDMSNPIWKLPTDEDFDRDEGIGVV
jgi:hypothetical protein